MNSPSEMLQIIHDAVGNIPDQIASTLGLGKPDMPDFPDGNLQGLGPSESPSMETGGGVESGSPIDFPSASAAFPDFPEFAASPVPASAAFPDIQSESYAGESADFPSLPGFSATASSMPAGDYSPESDMAQTLREIRDGLQESGRGSLSQPGFQRSSGPVQVGDPRIGVSDPDSDEDFSQASPSVNFGSTAGLRGAGGYGYGSRYDDSSLLSGGKRDRGNFVERR